MCSHLGGGGRIVPPKKYTNIYIYIIYNFVVTFVFLKYLWLRWTRRCRVGGIQIIRLSYPAPQYRFLHRVVQIVCIADKVYRVLCWDYSPNNMSVRKIVYSLLKKILASFYSYQKRTHGGIICKCILWLSDYMDLKSDLWARTSPTYFASDRTDL